MDHVRVRENDMFVKNILFVNHIAQQTIIARCHRRIGKLRNRANKRILVRVPKGSDISSQMRDYITITTIYLIS